MLSIWILNLIWLHTANAAVCDVSNWPGVAKVCGECKALLNNMGNSGPYHGKCGDFCAAQGLTCVSQQEERANDCVVEWTGSCDVAGKQNGGSSGDLLCECAGDTEEPTPSPTPAPVVDGEECESKTIYNSGPHKALIPVRNSNPLFYLDMTDAMTFYMDVTVNSIPSGWASVFHCGVVDHVRMPGLWLHPHTNQPGQIHQGFTIVFGTIANWNKYQTRATPALYPGETYHLEMKVTQSSFVVKLNDVIAMENHEYGPHSLNYHEPCYVGDPWYNAADVVIKNLEVITDCVPERCYNIEGGPGIISGDPHTYTFAGVRHDFQGKPYDGLDQFYYVAPCHGKNRDELPFQILGRHVPYRGSTRVAGLDYFAIELFDENEHQYVLFFSHAIHGYIMGEDTDYDAVKSLDGFTTLSPGTTAIGNRFAVDYTQTDSRNVHVIVKIDGECDLEFTMYGQHDWSSTLNRYTMHYVRVNPPECYKCAICGLFGDFQDYSMQTCDGRIMDGFGGWNNAWDERAWTWEKSFFKENCPVLPPGVTTTTPGPDDTPSPVYIPPTDPPYEDPCLDHESHLYKESERLCHAGRNRADVSACCDKIGGVYCADLLEPCPFDACVLSDGDANLIDDQVDDMLIQPILEECDDLVVDSSDYKRETSQPTHKPTAKPTQDGIDTDAPTPEPTRSPVTKRPTQRPSHNPTPSPTTADPTRRPTTARPTTAIPTVSEPTSSPTLRPSHNPTTAEPTRRPSQNPTTSDPTTARPTTPDPTKRPTTAEPTKRQTGWGAFKPTKPTVAKPTRPVKTPRPTKGPRPTKAPRPVRTPRPKPVKTPRPTPAKPVRTPRPTNAPRTKAPKPIKTPSPTHGGDYGPGDEGNDGGYYGKKKKDKKNTMAPLDMDNEEMIAVDLNGVSETTLSGYSAQTEIVGLSSVVTMLLLVGCTMVCKRGKDDKYALIEEPVV